MAYYYHYYFLAVFVVKLVSAFSILRGINSLSTQDESNKEKIIEFWPSFDDEPVKIPDTISTLKPLQIGGTQIMYPANVLDDTTSSTKILYFWQTTTTTPVSISSSLSTKLLIINEFTDNSTALTSNTTTTSAKNSISNHLQESIKKLDELYGKQSISLFYSINLKFYLNIFRSWLSAL